PRRLRVSDPNGTDPLAQADPYGTSPPQQGIITTRYNNNQAQTRSGVLSRWYGPTPVRLPGASRVVWDGTSKFLAMSMPNFSPPPPSPFQTVPQYLGTGFSDNSISPPTGAVLNHPSLFNPNEWPATTTTGRTF